MADGTSMELVELDSFYAPVPWTPIDDLLSQYQHRRTQVEQVAALFAGDIRGVVRYFIDGNNRGNDRGYSSYTAEKVFELPGAIAALNTDYWRRALNLTDFYNIMPQARRDGWNAQFAEQSTPDFTYENVHDTFAGLDADRLTFFAERVDGVFRALSHSHVTNSPMGFGQRFIFASLIDYYGGYNHARIGHLNDLRCVIAKFMGRDEPTSWCASSSLVDACRTHHRGSWVPVDGGSLRLRCYKGGTAHIELHPDMAWRLNAVLAHLYPAAIPASFRTAPKKKPKDFVMMGRPLPFAVVAAIAGMRSEPTMRPGRGHGEAPTPGLTSCPYALRFGNDADNAGARAEAQRVLSYLGGVKRTAGGHCWFEFDYDAGSVLAEVVASGCLPDQRAHQFYPTPEPIARVAVEMAQIGTEHACLEPSAGVGGLADFMPSDRTTCIEVSGLHCTVLRSKRYTTVCADFLAWAQGTLERFDRIVMNPPFSDSRASLHLHAAAALLAPGGRLVAILPGSLHGQDIVDGFSHAWGERYSGAFAGTSITVAILVLDRAHPD